MRQSTAWFIQVKWNLGGYDGGKGIEILWGRDFPCHSRPAPWPTQILVQWVPCFFRGVKKPWRRADHPPISNAEVAIGLEPHLRLPFVPAQRCRGVTFEFTMGWLKLNPLIAELNPICHLLALLGAHHILHVSRIRVNREFWRGNFFISNICKLRRNVWVTVKGNVR